MISPLCVSRRCRQSHSGVQQLPRP